MVQLAGAYTMFNTGTFTTPHYYTEITDYQGNMILDNNKYINTTQAISADTAYIMNRMMWNVLHSRKGTAYGKGPTARWTLWPRPVRRATTRTTPLPV